MKICHDQNSPRVVSCDLFFLGFGMTPQVLFDRIRKDSAQPLVVFSHYHEPTPQRIPVAKNYRVFAWSFGVARAWDWLSQTNQSITSITFCNGTPTPIDRRLGIHPQIVQKMQRTLTPQSFQHFCSLCVQPDFAIWTGDLPQRSITDAKEELTYFLQRKNDCVSKTLPTHHPTPQIFAGKFDKVIPLPAQQRAWEALGYTPTLLESGHTPWSFFEKWINSPYE